MCEPCSQGEGQISREGGVSAAASAMPPQLRRRNLSCSTEVPLVEQQPAQHTFERSPLGWRQRVCVCGLYFSYSLLTVNSYSQLQCCRKFSFSPQISYESNFIYLPIFQRKYKEVTIYQAYQKVSIRLNWSPLSCESSKELMGFICHVLFYCTAWRILLSKDIFFPYLAHTFPSDSSKGLHSCLQQH